MLMELIRPGTGSPDNLEEVDEFSGTEPPVMGVVLQFQVIMSSEYRKFYNLSRDFFMP